MEQLSLFDANQPSLAIDAKMKACLARGVKGSGLSRAQVVDRLNALAVEEGIQIGQGNSRSGLSLDLFEKWLNPRDERRMPVHLLPLFMTVVGSLEPLEILASSVQAAVITGRQVHALRWGEKNLKAKQDRKEMQLLEALYGQK